MDLPNCPKSISKLFNHIKDKNNEFPSDFDDINNPALFFISVSDGKKPATIAVGKGEEIKKVVDQLAVSNPKWIKIDVVHKLDALNNEEELIPELEGLVLSTEPLIALLPHTVNQMHLIKEDGTLNRGKIAHYIENEHHLKGERELQRFCPDSYFYNNGTEYPLYRGHRIWEEVTAQNLLDASLRGADYLERAQNEDGSFVYTYNPSTFSTIEKFVIFCDSIQSDQCKQCFAWIVLRNKIGLNSSHMTACMDKFSTRTLVGKDITAEPLCDR